MDKVFFGAEVEGVMFAKATKKPMAMTLLAPLKDKPIMLETGEAVHADCSGAETASTPSSSAKEVLASLQRGFDWWANTYPDYELQIIPVGVYDEKDMHPVDDWTIGCSPSVCVWPDAPNTPQKYKNTARCYGLHITFDLPDDNIGDIEEIVKSLDYRLALWCQNNSPCPEMDKQRREIGYGRPGEFRLKHLPNGKTLLEYRTLPNWAYVHLEMFQDIITKLLNDDEYRHQTVAEYSSTPDFWKQLVKGE